MPPKKPSFQISVEVITPQKAEQYLYRNTHNRKLRPRRVEILSGAMKRGEWKANGDSIRFDKNGRLVDGQHRLHAIIDSGVSVEMVVIEGLGEDAQMTMDTVDPRTLANTLELSGYADSGKLAAAITYLWKMENKRVREVSAKPTIAQAMALFAEHPGILDSMSVARQVSSRFRCSPAQLAALHYTMSGLDSDDADFFFAHLASGADLSEKSPIYLLRDWFVRKTNSPERYEPVHGHGMIVKAWNAYRRGEEIVRLQWVRSGPRAEPVPEVE